MQRVHTIVSSLVCVFLLSLVPGAGAQQIKCRSTAAMVKAVTSPDYHAVTTRYRGPRFPILIDRASAPVSRGSKGLRHL